jgi:cysteine desulfurase / selenocysteine lyase
MAQAILDDFPTARTVTYLNSASISLMPRPAIESMIDFQQKIAAGGTIGFDEEAETQALEIARNETASLIQAKREEVAVLSSASEGICAVAWSLGLKKGGNVVSTDADFPSVVYPWMRSGRSVGLEVRLARNHDGEIRTNELENLVDERTSVISISHVEYGTGQRFDLKWLSELAHSHGAILVVDATQSAGLVPIDVHGDGVDVLVASGYKGLLGPFGAAILYVREDLLQQLEPPFVGWRSTPVPYDLDATRMTFPTNAKKFEYSTMSYSSAVGLGESIRYLKQHGYSAATNHVSSLTQSFIRMMRNRHGEAIVLTPSETGSQASIASFRFGGHDQSAIAAALVKRGVIVSQRFNGIRFSFHIYNSERDLSSAMEKLDQVLIQ